MYLFFKQKIESNFLLQNTVDPHMTDLQKALLPILFESPFGL